MSEHGFTSAFATELDAYLAFKENMGFYGSSRVWYLKQFDAYCAEGNRTALDRSTVEGWVTVQLGRSGPYRSWMSYARDFGRWLRTNGAPDAYVLSGDWKAPFVPAHPYLLAQREIALFFDAAGALKAQSPWRWQAAAFFTLMHSCGLRTGEVRALRTEHVDLDDGHVDIVWSKGNRSRRLPLTGDVIDVLDACDRMARERFVSRRAFFVSATGNQVTQATVGVISAASGTRQDWPVPSAANSRARTTSGTISPTPTSNDGRGREKMSPRCSPIYRAIWATRHSTAPTTTCTPLPIS